MATSSIFANVVIDTKEGVDRFVRAMEESEKALAQTKPIQSNIKTVTDPTEIRRLFATRTQKP